MNCDFETYLETGNHFLPNSTTVTQEFEYLIALIEKKSTLYSNKEYDDEYLGYIESLVGYRPLISKDPKGAEPWCANFKNIDIKRKLQSKVETAKFAIKNSLCHSSTQIISSFEECFKDSIVKFPFGVSGSGHCLPFFQEKLIRKRLMKSQAVAEKLLDREIDLGAFYNNGELQGIYINDVDSRFQYKGSFFGVDDMPLHSEYLQALAVISAYVKEQKYDGPFSVDSFIYREDGELKLYALSEINVRKTMGSSAGQIGRQLFPKAKFVKFGIFKNTGDFDHFEIQKYFSGELLLLSPNNNKFHSYIVSGRSREELLEIEVSFFKKFTG